jgi:hypothetical protein
MATLTAWCEKNGHTVESDPNVRIDDDLYLLLAKEFAKDLAVKIEADRQAAERQAREDADREAAEAAKKAAAEAAAKKAAEDQMAQLEAQWKKDSGETTYAGEKRLPEILRLSELSEEPARQKAAQPQLPWTV